MNRADERKWITKLIFQNDFNEFDYSMIEDVIDKHNIKLSKFAYNSIESILNNKEKIDEIIDSKLIGRKTQDLPAIERAVLRVSINEFYIQKTVPVSVSINEAVENIKIFSIGNSHKLINGILSSVAKDMK
nr:transcription antitermination factor NusB [Helcococcus sueciensis]